MRFGENPNLLDPSSPTKTRDLMLSLITPARGRRRRSAGGVTPVDRGEEEEGVEAAARSGFLWFRVSQREPNV